MRAGSIIMQTRSVLSADWISYVAAILALVNPPPLLSTLIFRRHHHQAVDRFDEPVGNNTIEPDDSNWRNDATEEL